MKKHTYHYSFKDILRRLAEQEPEEKLRTAFKLNDFVKKIHQAGQEHANTSNRYQPC
jgi:hypothetical protein